MDRIPDSLVADAQVVGSPCQPAEVGHVQGHHEPQDSEGQWLARGERPDSVVSALVLSAICQTAMRSFRSALAQWAEAIVNWSSGYGRMRSLSSEAHYPRLSRSCQLTLVRYRGDLTLADPGDVGPALPGLV